MLSKIKDMWIMVAGTIYGVFCYLIEFVYNLMMDISFLLIFCKQYFLFLLGCNSGNVVCVYCECELANRPQKCKPEYLNLGINNPTYGFSIKGIVPLSMKDAAIYKEYLLFQDNPYFFAGAMYALILYYDNKGHVKIIGSKKIQ